MHMYSTARFMSTITAILSAVNVVGFLLFLMASASLNLAFALSFAIFLFMGSSAAINLCLTVALRSLCQDLEYEYEGSAAKLSEMSKKIKEVESKN